MEDAFDRVLREARNYFSTAEEGLRRAHSDVLVEARQKELEEQNALRKQSEDANARLEKLETAYAEVIAELECTQQKLSESHSKIQALHDKNKSIESKSEALKGEWESKCEVLQKANEKLRGDIEVALGYRKRCGILERSNTQLRHELGLLADKCRALEAHHRASTLGRDTSASGSGVGIHQPATQLLCSPSVKCTAKDSQQQKGSDNGATDLERVVRVGRNTSELRSLLRQCRKDNRSLRKGYKRVREESLLKGFAGRRRMVSIGVQAQGTLKGVSCRAPSTSEQLDIEYAQPDKSGSQTNKEDDSRMAICQDENRKLLEGHTGETQDACTDSRQRVLPTGSFLQPFHDALERKKVLTEANSGLEGGNETRCASPGQNGLEGELANKVPCRADEFSLIDLVDPSDSAPDLVEAQQGTPEGAGACLNCEALSPPRSPAVGPAEEEPQDKAGRETQKPRGLTKKDIICMDDFFDPTDAATPSLESPEDELQDDERAQDGQPVATPVPSKVDPLGQFRGDILKGDPPRLGKASALQNSRSPAKRQASPLSPRSTVPGRLPLITLAGPKVAVPFATEVEEDGGADQQGKKLHYKYAEVIRNKPARAALPAFECPDCAAFYNALESWGHNAGAVLPCGHAKPQASAVRMMAENRGRPGQPSVHPSTRSLCQQASRHRHRFPPPPTPDGFWDLGFNDSEQCN